MVISYEVVLFLITLVTFVILLLFNLVSWHYKGWRYWVGSLLASLGFASLILKETMAGYISAWIYIIAGLCLWLIKGRRKTNSK